MGKEIKNTANQKAKVYTEIFNKIYEGEYRSGSRLIESDLTKEYGISRTPVREILRSLENIGLVKISRNRGAIVIGITYDDIEEIYNIRKSLELLALESAYSRIPLQTLSEIKSQILLLNELSSPDEISKIDEKLHEYIIESSHMPRLKNILQQLFILLNRFRYVSYRDSKGIDSSKREHLELITAIYSRNLEKAKRILDEHIENSKHEALSYLFENIEIRNK